MSSSSYSKTASIPSRDNRPKTIRYFLKPQMVQKTLRTTLNVQIHFGHITDQPEEYRPLLQIISPRRPAPEYITPEDAEWIAQLQTNCKTAGEPNIFILHTQDNEHLLRQIVASRRCYFGSSTRAFLRAGPELPAEPVWQIIDENHLRLMLVTQPRIQTILPMGRPWYYHARQGQIGPLRVVGSAPHMALLHSMGEQLRTDLPEWNWRALGIPAPPEIHSSRLEGITPSPVLMLTTAKPDSRPIARLFFDYRGHALEVASPVREQSLVKIKEDHFIRISRRTDLENAYLQNLLDLGLVLFNSTIGRRQQRVLGSSKEQQSVVWQNVMRHLETLREQHWKVKINRSFCYVEPKNVRWEVHAVTLGPTELTGTFSSTGAPNSTGALGSTGAPNSTGALGFLGATGASGAATFKADLFVHIHDEKIPLLPLIQQWLSNPDSNTTPRLLLQDGKEMFLPPERIEAILSTLFSVFNRNSRSVSRSSELHLSAQMLPAFAQLRQSMSGDDVEWNTDEVFRQSIAQLEQLRHPVAIPPPAALDATLRDYQRIGTGWLQCLSEHEFHGILADDMGLGKTIQVIAHLLDEKTRGRLDCPALIVAPTSLLFNWECEIKRFAPTLRSIIHHGSERHDQSALLHEYDCIITSYTLLVRDHDFHAKQLYSYLILDESQKIKNPSTAVARTACAMNARHRLCLTGTPIENHLGEIWSQFHFLMPGLLGSKRQFERLYQIPIERHSDQEKRTRLTDWLAPFILRRTKQNVALELPPKTEIVRYVQLSTKQRDLYESVRLTLLPQLREYLRNNDAHYTVNVLTALLKLRQICCDPRLIAPSDFTQAHSAKLEMLLEMIHELVEEGRRILIFSQFTSMLKLIEQALLPTGLRWLKLTGRTRQRQPLIEAFQQGDIPIFLISLKAGGTGLNLTAADVVIHYDPWWNPAVEQQATDRAHRIGQDQPVFSYKLITLGTVEERIARMQERKQSLADDILSATSASRELHSSEWESLFAPFEPDILPA